VHTTREQKQIINKQLKANAKTYSPRISRRGGNWGMFWVLKARKIKF